MLGYHPGRPCGAQFFAISASSQIENVSSVMSYQPSSFSFQLELTRGDGERARGTSGAEARIVYSSVNAGLKASTTVKVDPLLDSYGQLFSRA